MAGPLPQSMRFIDMDAPGGPEVLKPATGPAPRPAPQEVLIRVAAAGINRPDLLQRMGSYPPPRGALLKNEQDVHLFERLAFLDCREQIF